jgi:aldehyde:ferredoxin oxidoreductase
LYEYVSRQVLYDSFIVDKHKVDIKDMSTEEKVRLLREFRESMYEKLKDAVYERRGWTNDGIPTVETVKRLGIDFPEVMDLLKS